MPSQPNRQIPFSYATCSINAPSLPAKLAAISKAGFTGIELAFPDLLDYGAHILGHAVADDNEDELVQIAGEVRELCRDHGLEVMMLQPFANFEGWPRGSREREDAFRRARRWIAVMGKLETKILQVGSTDIPVENLSPSRENVIADLRELSDLLAERNMRVAYENWCWSTHAPTWKDVWEIVRDVKRPNVGLCLDTFQTAGSEWADPTTESGRMEDYPVGLMNQRLEQSLAELAREVPPEKIYLLQVSDAYKPTTPLEAERVDGMWPRARWSHDYRPLPYDGGYLPIEAVARAVLKTGFQGWFSMEVFDGGPDGRGKQYDPEEYVEKAMRNMKEFLEKSEGACIDHH
ncbi:hypothetical protein N8T08_006402 [Aspergillus melleus]|uniref:Uncharacterized protein n=1 Tax=Aspergillus melleus TaxID=138277 RepID=A0ACC3BES0_9EURO|nr:hypothetical protein N8T08_006402 [Aspergillus melleus]